MNTLDVLESIDRKTKLIYSLGFFLDSVSTFLIDDIIKLRKEINILKFRYL